MPGAASRWTATTWPRRLPSSCLRRWGVVFRDLAVHDGLHIPWREVQWALRRLEDRGLVRGGRFVSGFSGEQYALPEAVEQLTACAGSRVPSSAWRSTRRTR